MSRSILISGWRGLPHSYAMVNQHQCLELLRRPDIDLYFEDRPLADPSWTRTSGLFPPSEEALLNAIPSRPDRVTPDIEFRIAFPYDLVSPPIARRTFVFGTSEYQFVSPNYIQDRLTLIDALAMHEERMTIVTPSNWSRDGFIASGADPERVVVVPHGVDTAVYFAPSAADRKSARAKHNIADDELVFLNVGAMTGNKNIAMLLRSFAAVLRSYPKSKLLLKGIDALYRSKSLFMTAALQSLPGEDAALALPKTIYLGGSLSGGEMAEIYHASDCYVSPYTAEGFNLPVVEAAACGLPIICTAGGPTDEFTTDDFAMRIESSRVINEMDGVTANSLAPDEVDLKRLMETAVTNEQFRLEARISGPSFVEAHLTWKRVVDRLLALFFPGQ